jgi:hypothetical protein
VKAIVEVVDPIGTVGQAGTGALVDPTAIVEAAALVDSTVIVERVVDPIGTVGQAGTGAPVGPTAIVEAAALVGPIAVQVVEASSDQERLACGFAKVT